jgi:hypothetical protein
MVHFFTIYKYPVYSLFKYDTVPGNMSIPLAVMKRVETIARFFCSDVCFRDREKKKGFSRGERPRYWQVEKRD